MLISIVFRAQCREEKLQLLARCQCMVISDHDLHQSRNLAASSVPADLNYRDFAEARTIDVVTNIADESEDRIKK